MKGLQLDVQKYTFGQLLKRFEPLAVPLFQRPYSWDKEQWIQLWEDLSANLGGDYLIGGVVLCGTDHDENQIIDGQQRLTTLTILAAVFRDLAYVFAEEATTETVLSFQNDLIANKPLSASKSTPYLRLGEIDKEWFQQRIQLRPDDMDFNAPSTPVRSRIASSIRLQWKCYLFFRQQVEKAVEGKTRKQSLELFASYHELLVKGLWFVVTRVPDDDTAFTLFEVLNDRGLDLTVADLIKNVVLSEGAKHKVFEKAKEHWSAVTDSLDYSVVSAFLRSHWMSESGEKITEKALFGELKVKLRRASKQEFLGILSQWAREAQAYAEIAGHTELTSEDGSLARELRLLKAYGFRIVHSVLLAVWATTSERENKKRATAVRHLRTFLVRYAVFANQATNTLEADLAKLAAEIRENKGFETSWLRTKLLHLSPDDGLVWAGFEVLEPSIQVARLLLTEIEEHLGGEEKWVRGAEAVHVEHIFPQRPDAEWIAAFAANGDHDTFRDRLGNLTLLAGSKNRSASNKTFSEKVKVYKDSELTITNSIPDQYKKWTAESVVERQRDLLEAARKAWALE
ncbi:MAG TPA: DUF262 domain-containing HNH endonuclease family protein [Gemmatimonadaceae bacterium]|nr:DUF262 domain-containing HNH endonuclease family protein [Gemmatimonadaceae bacterium]HRQ77623.1 DUF262 domain-containing HNH endonuclease family protein [Gemmatimonadaceae bacterium]